MTSLAKRAPRTNLAFTHIDDHQLGRYFYAVTLGAWLWPDDLEIRETRVLTAFCVLARSGDHGWIGSKATAGAMAAFVHRITGERCGRSTYLAAVAGLVHKGYLLRSVYGGGKPRLVHAATDPGDEDVWRPGPRTVLTLTPKALAVWARCPTLSPRFSPVQKLTGNELTLVLPRETRENPARVPVVVEPIPAHEETEAVSPAGTVESRSHSLAVEASADVAADTLQPSRALGGHRGRKRKARASQHIATPPATRTGTARKLLAVLVFCAASRGRAGKAAVARAALELADPRLAARSAVAWDYWIAEWPKLSQAEQRHVCRADILPALATSPPMIVLPSPPATPSSSPSSPARSPTSSAHTHHQPTPDEITDAMRAAAAAGNPFAIRWLAQNKSS